MNAHQTQKYFFKAITENKLDELLKRADPTTKVLENHINEQLTAPLTCLVKLKRVVGMYCDVYLEYFDSGSMIGYFSLHFKRDDKSLTNKIRSSGRIHFRNVNKSCYTIKCNTRKINNANNSVRMYYETGQYIRPKLQQCIDITLDILNKYMDFNSDISLDIQMTQYKGNHTCLTDIITHFKKVKKNEIRRTRKASKHSRSIRR